MKDLLKLTLGCVALLVFVSYVLATAIALWLFGANFLEGQIGMSGEVAAFLAFFSWVAVVAGPVAILGMVKGMEL